jgi:hypothetical protein
VMQFCCLWLAAVQLQAKWCLCSVNSEFSGCSYLDTIQSAFVVDASLIQHERDIALVFGIPLEIWLFL